LKVLRSGGRLPLGATVCIETQAHSRLNLARDFHAMPLSICVLLSFHPVCGHERALLAFILYMHDGHYPGLLNFGNGAVGYERSQPTGFPAKPTF
jgi:hypothetical protein